MNYLGEAKRIRAIKTPHYNCAQAVLLAYQKKLNIDKQTLFNLASNFGAGMKMGSVCGALTGGLMLLGLLGINDPQVIQSFENKFKEKHQSIECETLLKSSLERGEKKKTHCDQLVYEIVNEVEIIGKAKGLL